MKYLSKILLFSLIFSHNYIVKGQTQVVTHAADVTKNNNIDGKKILSSLYNQTTYVKTTKQKYSTDEEIIANYTLQLSADLRDRQWVIVMADSASGLQKWLSFNPGEGNSSSGEMNFGKGKPGKYELRILLMVPPNRAKGLQFENLLAKTNFEVTEEPEPDKPKTFVRTSKQKYSVNEEIKVNYELLMPANLKDRQWVIVLADSASGLQKWLSFNPGEGNSSSGEMNFGKGKPGKYEIRLLLLVPPDRAKGLQFENLLAKISFEVIGD